VVNRRNDKRACVMIVEQDVGFGFKLADWLAARGYQPVLVRSVESAIEGLSNISPQLVFVGRDNSEPAAQIEVSKILRVIRTLCPGVRMITIADRVGKDLTQVGFRQEVHHFGVMPVEFSQISHVLQSELSSSAATMGSSSAT
jgi:DNA-binding NtrC family response regulator